MKIIHAPRTALAAIVLSAIAAASLAGPDLSAQTSGFSQTAAGTYDYNSPLNWIGGNINGLWDAGLTLTGTQTVQFAAPATLADGLTFAYDGGFNVSLTATGGAQTVTLGGDIAVNTVSTTRTITIGSTTGSQNLNVDLGGATRSFTVGSGRTLGFVNVISNGALNLAGGSINFSGINTYSGATTVTSGAVGFNGSNGSSANSDILIVANMAATTVSFGNGGTSAGVTRAKSVTLDGSYAAGTATATLNIIGNSNNNSTETITNALAVSEGFGIVSLSTSSTKNLRLHAGSFDRQAGSTVLIRGAGLGTATTASQTANTTNITFGSAPTLAGGGGASDTTTMGILVGTYGSTTTANTVGEGLLTYDATRGVRLLNSATEYAATIASGQTQLDNVLLQRASGGSSQDINLAAGTTVINSLSFKITGAGANSGITIGGDAGAVLRLNSGAIFANQAVTTATSSDAMVLSVPTLDLNGHEGTIITFTNGFSQSNTPAPLQINSVIANDGGNGVTIGGNGQVIFGGADANTYTGVTTINSGVLRLSKTTANVGLTTDLVMNGGTLLKNSNAIADTANVTINGGTFVMDSSTSSGNNGHQETINNFTLNRGALANSAGTGATLTINGTATLNGSQLGMNQGGDIIVNGATNLNGGMLVARESSSTSSRNGLTSLNAVNITHTASGAYTAIRLNAHATNLGAQLTLNGDLTFVGNSNNANTVLVASSDSVLANQGVFLLEGSRAFNIGNGAAAIDLDMQVALTNGTAAGALVKTGSGSLALSGANTYTGATTVTAGTLLLGASDRISDVSALVMNGGTFGTGGFSETLGALSLSASSSIDLGSGASALAFADSSDSAWGGSFSLSIVNFTAGVDSIRIGTSGAGLTGDQLAQITINGLAATIDSAGYLGVSAIPEPSAAALAAGLGGLGLAALRRRRRIA